MFPHSFYCWLTVPLSLHWTSEMKSLRAQFSILCFTFLFLWGSSVPQSASLLTRGFHSFPFRPPQFLSDHANILWTMEEQAPLTLVTKDTPVSSLSLEQWVGQCLLRVEQCPCPEPHCRAPHWKDRRILSGDLSSAFPTVSKQRPRTALQLVTAGYSRLQPVAASSVTDKTHPPLCFRTSAVRGGGLESVRAVGTLHQGRGSPEVLRPTHGGSKAAPRRPWPIEDQAGEAAKQQQWRETNKQTEKQDVAE